ncbi:HET-domain-containing protein [Apiospora saccharicola]|uniref:HET-domain-containing protein n=1 Tax=Apiospora saccharicola TaxID=335842 RepID=A0ABR1V993_9PEZI
MLYVALSALDDVTRASHGQDQDVVRHYVLALQAGVRADRHHPPTTNGASAHDYAEVVRQLLAGTLTADRAAASPGLSMAIGVYCENLVGRRLGWDTHTAPVLCAGSAQAGDQVSLLVGCRFPMLLRPSPADRGSQSYVVVGQCVMVDTCDGEAMLGPLPDEYGGGLVAGPETGGGGFARIGCG